MSVERRRKCEPGAEGGVAAGRDGDGLAMYIVKVCLYGIVATKNCSYWVGTV